MCKLIYLALFFILAGCSTTPDVTEPSIEPAVEVKPVGKRLRPPINLDYEGLANSMNMNPPKETLGFKEKVFNTCTAGYGYSASQDCRENYFSVINFRLLCRESEGTISVALNPEDLRPLSGRPISWLLDKRVGSFRIDNEGYGQIKTTSEGSLRGERLKITADNDFLYLRAGQVNRIVTPGNWCN